MSRRQFDDYDPNEWEEEHKRAERERRKRDAKRHRHDDEKGEESRGPPTSTGLTDYIAF